MACRNGDFAVFGRFGWYWAFFAAISLAAVFSFRLDAACICSDGIPVSETMASSWSRVSDRYLNAGEYLDRGWYDVLDEGQYYYLDEYQYNLLGGLNYLLRHPAYPKLFESVAGGGIGFESGGHTGFFGFYDGFVIGHGAERTGNGADSRELPTVFSSRKVGDYIDRLWYLYLDRGQYYYLDQTQYLLVGGLGYLYGRFSANPFYYGTALELRSASDRGERRAQGKTVPEPATITVFGLGCLLVRGLRRGLGERR